MFHQNLIGAAPAHLPRRAGPRKANTMDKSADDWSGYKRGDAGVHAELHAHAGSGDKYLERQAFLRTAGESEHAARKAGAAAAAPRDKPA
jgi:Bucentaur or craniofacial development